MNSDGLQRRLLELQGKIQEGQDAMREWAELQVQLRGPSLVAGNGNPYIAAHISAPPQNPPASGLQEAGSSHLLATTSSAQQRPPPPTYPSTSINQTRSVGPASFSSLRQPQPHQNAIHVPRSDGSDLDARTGANTQAPHVPVAPRNQAAPVNPLSGSPAELEGQARNVMHAGYTRNTSGYTAHLSGQQQQHPPPQPQRSTARHQPMHIMQAAYQQPQSIASSSSSLLQATRPVENDHLQHQNSHRSFPDSISSRTQPLDALLRALPRAHTSRPIGRLPEWTDQELTLFKRALEAWQQKVPIGTGFDLFHCLKFGEGYSIRKLADGLYVEDNGDKLKCPITALYEQLEKRKKLGPHQVVAPPTSISQVNSRTSVSHSQPSVAPPPVSQSVASATPSSSLQLVASAGQAIPVSSALNSVSVPAMHAPVVTPVSKSLSQQPPSQEQIHQATPGRHSVRAPVVRSPANANKKTLARDVLFALGKRSRPSNEPVSGPAAKRPAMGTSVAPPANRTNTDVSGPALPRPPLPSAPSNDDTNSAVPRTVLPRPPLSSAPSNDGTKSAVPRTVPSPPSPSASSTSDSNPPKPGVVLPRPPLPSAPSANGTNSAVARPHPPSPRSIGAVPYYELSTGSGRRANPAIGSIPPSRQVISGKPSSPNIAEVSGTTEGISSVPQASADPTAQATAPPVPSLASLEPSSSPVRPELKASEQTATSPILPPIATIDEIGSSPSRPASPVQAQRPARSPSITVSDLAPYPPTSSASNKSSFSVNLEAGPSRSKALKAEIRSSPSRRKSSPAISVSSAASEEPLFLPSGSAPSSPEIADRLPSSAQTNKSGTASKRKGKEREAPEQRPKHQFYVLIPPPSPRTRRFMQLHHQPSPSEDTRSTPSMGAIRLSSSRTVAAPSTTELDVWPLEEEDEKEYDFSYDAQGNKIEDPTERTLMELACTQLQPLPCKWDRCDVVMNSVTGMLSHLKRQHRPASKDGRVHFSCMWSQCGKQCRVKDNKHFVKHALEALTCPYAGCNKALRTAGQLRRHASSNHAKQRFKPSFKPFAPRNLVPPPNAPDVLPSYMGVSRVVMPASISPAQHDVLYPRVLKKVKGAAKRTKPIRLERYAFLNEQRTRHSSYLSEPVGNIKVWDMPWSVRLTELCRQDRVTILEEGSRRARIAKALENKVESPAEPDLLNLEGGSQIHDKDASSPGPVEQDQSLDREEGEKDDGEEREGLGMGAGIDTDEGDEPGESDLVVSMLL